MRMPSHKPLLWGGGGTSAEQGPRWGWKFIPLTSYRGEGMSLARHFLKCLFHLLVYQQPQQQQMTSSYGGYKEPAAPVSIQRSAPGGGGVSNCLE